MNFITVNIKKLNDDAIIPQFSYSTDSGADIFSVDDIIINSGERALIHTGIAIELPDGYECQVRSKSGIALKSGVFVLNSPGTIDQDYRGECNVILFNAGKEPYHITKGQKIAQFVIKPVLRVNFIEKTEISNTSRSTKGFGSTGLK